VCDWGQSEEILVLIPADLSSTGKAKWKMTGVDKCIAGLIKALQKGGVNMRACCCGHNKREGYIDLQDGRVLLILSPEQGRKYLGGARDLFPG